MRKQFLSIAGIILSLAGATAVRGAPAGGGPVVASVNGEAITQDALVQRLLSYHGKASLEAMINRLVVEQEAKRLGVAVTNTELDARMALIKNQLGGAESYSSFLERSGLTEPLYREQVRGTLLIERIVAKTNPVKDADLEQAIVRVILVPNEEQARSVATVLKNGGDFIQLARERSTDEQTREQGGLLPPLLRSDYPDIWSAITDLKPGQTTAPVKVPMGYAIVKLERRRSAAQQSEQDRERNRARVMSARLNQWLDAARKRAKITYGAPLPAP
jgi:foldase protein PrsA